MLIPCPPGSLSGEGRLRLLKQTSCNTWICSLDRLFELGYLPNERPGMKIVTMPSLEYFLDGDSKHYPYTKTYDEAKDDPVWIIHTSGTTGLYVKVSTPPADRPRIPKTYR